MGPKFRLCSFWTGKYIAFGCKTNVYSLTSASCRLSENSVHTHSRLISAQAPLAWARPTQHRVDSMDPQSGYQSTLQTLTGYDETGIETEHLLANFHNSAFVKSNKEKMGSHIHFSSALFLFHFPKYCFWIDPFPQPSLTHSFFPLLFTQVLLLTQRRVPTYPPSPHHTLLITSFFLKYLPPAHNGLLVV